MPALCRARSGSCSLYTRGIRRGPFGLEFPRLDWRGVWELLTPLKKTTSSAISEGGGERF